MSSQVHRIYYTTIKYKRIGNLALLHPRKKLAILPRMRPKCPCSLSVALYMHLTYILQNINRKRSLDHKKQTRYVAYKPYGNVYGAI